MHELPFPMRRGNDAGTFIYLPTDKNFIQVYREFKGFYLDNILKDGSESNLEKKIISYSSFRRLWNELMPNLKFQPPVSDLCENYVQFKSKLQLAKKRLMSISIIKSKLNS